MRFYITLAVIILIGFFAFRSCTDNFGSSKKKPETKPEKPFIPLSIPQDKPPSSSEEPQSSSSSQQPHSSRASKFYRFSHREPPPASELQSSSTGCTISVDRFSRTVLASGPERDISALLEYFHQIDTVGGSCSVQAWAVYVDKSAQKGFDFIAALGAVLDGENTVTIGNGSIVWDIGGSDINAALAVIADGSVVEVIQRPHVHLEQGAISKIESLQEVPIPSTSVSQGIAQTSVDYRKVGLQLLVTPYFFGNERLRLVIEQSNGLLGRDVRIGENDVPIIESQTVSSTVEMSIGQSVVLGGVTTLRNKVSKGLFKNTTETSEGSLYVVISTSSSIPKALPVFDPLSPVDPSSVPFSPGFQDPREWISDQLLPRKGWQHQEREFIDSKITK